MVEPLVIQDRYEVIRRLAIGGMGEIFLARQVMSRGGRTAGISRLVILKTLRPELAEQADALDQFLDEARVASLLSHPNIVAVYEVSVHNGVHFIAMEYIGGIDVSVLLKSAAKQDKRIPPRVAAAIVRDAAAGLDYAHNAKDEAGRSLHVVHRDVSPHNIMIRADGLVKVVDFGVAVASNQMHETQGDKLKGKIRYMSPEQLLGEELDGRSDQFSLGIVLWELVSGRALFSGNNPIDVFQKILGGEVPALADAPAGLREIVARMLSVKKDARFPRMTDVANALRAWIDAGAAGANVDDEVQRFVHEIAGSAIADRVKDLTPRAPSLSGLSDSLGLSVSGEGDPVGWSADTQAPTKIVARSREGGAVDDGADETKAMRVPGAAADVPELSDAGVLLHAAEHSGVLHGDRRFVTVLVGLLPGWSSLVQQIANVPMGAFGVNRVKNLFFRQLQTLAENQGGHVVRRGSDSFVVAFGLRGADAKDAERALSCAFATQKILDDLAKDPRQRLTAHMGVASGTAISDDDDDRPLHLAGAVVEKAERLAALARERKRGILVSAQVGELARGPVNLADAGVEIGGENVLEATGVVESKAPATRRKKVLIADDAEVFRRIEEEILRPFAYAFVHAKDGAQALKLAVEEAPDLILLDIQMPVMDGVQVLQFLKRTDKTKDIPVVVVTTIGRSHDEDLMRRGGADAFLTKPVKPGILIQTVRKLLGE